MTPCPNPKCDHGYETVIHNQSWIGPLNEPLVESLVYQVECPDCRGKGFIEQDETKEKEEVE